jgi:hypothetical protein
MQADYTQQIQDAFNSLPKVVQEAITDADIQAQLRQLAKSYSLHLDKWVELENEIMLAIVGISEPRDLPENIVERVGLTHEQAVKITQAVAAIVFDPIQEKLKTQVGEAKSTLESIDSQDQEVPKTPLDISKFSGAPLEPQTYSPKAQKNYPASTDPYHEPVE